MTYTIALVTPHTNSHRTAEETLALGYLASILRQHDYNVVIVDGWLRGLNPSEIVQSVCENGYPHVVCMSCYRSNLDQAKEFLYLLKQKIGVIPLICGGYGPTFHDSDFLEAGFTVAVRGEAEQIIAKLVNALILNLDLSSIPGISFKNGSSVIRTNREDPVFDLDSLPFPARDEVVFAKKLGNPIHVCTSRGCDAHCSYCSIFAFALGASPNHRWRYRSIKNIVEELRYLYESFGVTHVKFVDDSFLEPPRDEKWASGFAEEVLRYNLPLHFRTQVRADRLTEPIVESLVQAGWFSTSVGIENISATALKRMGKTAVGEDNLRALSLLKHFGVHVQMGMILFDHATTMNELEENYQFFKNHDWVITKGIFTEMFAAKGTPYTKSLSRKGVLAFDAVLQNYQYEIDDHQSRRVYKMLKDWHKSHSGLHDWIVDSVAAPKVLPKEGYIEVSRLCKELIVCDTRFFRLVLDHVKSESEGDEYWVSHSIANHAPFYRRMRSSIHSIYERYSLVYDGAPNPFLD